MLKKSLAVLVSLCCILPLFTAVAVAEDAGTPLTTAELWTFCEPGFGDLDGGGIGVSDARLALRISAGFETASSPEQLAAGDVDCSGSIDIGDARSILRCAAGVGNLGEEIIMKYFRAAADGVKTSMPGLSGTLTTVCPSILVTIPSAEIQTQELSALADYMDEQIAAYEKYKAMIDPFLTTAQRAQLDQQIAQWKAQRANIDKAYEPTVSTLTANAGTSHNYKFPVRGQAWSSRARSSDAASVQMTQKDGIYTITVKYGTFVYKTLPDDMTTLPYGRMFNLPAKTYLTNSRTLNRLTLKDGSVIFTIDAATGAVLGASYFYTYLWDFTLTDTDPTTGEAVSAQYVYTVNNTAEYTITQAVQPG